MVCIGNGHLHHHQRIIYVMRISLYACVTYVTKEQKQDTELCIVKFKQKKI